MESLRRQLGVSGVWRMTTTMCLPLSQGGGKPPPTPSPRATRPPPEPPPVSPGWISSFQLFNTRPFAHPPSTASKVTSFTLSALHLPRIPQFSATRNSPPESPVPPGFVRSLFPQHQDLRSDLHNLFFHFPFSDPPFTLTVCGDHENKAELWAGVCDVSVSTLLFRLKELLAKGDVHIDPICRDLSVFEIASDGVVAAELKEERSFYRLFYSFRGLPNALLLRCSKWKLLSAKVLDSDQSLKWGTQLRYHCSESYLELFEFNPFLDWTHVNTLFVKQKCTELVIDSKNCFHLGNQIHSILFSIVSPMPSCPSLPDTPRCVAKLCCIWNIMTKVSRRGLIDHEGSGNTLDVGSYQMKTVRKFNSQLGGHDMNALVARLEFPKGGLTLRPPSKLPDLNYLGSWTVFRS